MSLFDWLGLGGESGAKASEPSAGATDTVRKIVSELKAMEPEHARFVAAFAYILGRVAFADMDITEEETRAMEQAVMQYGDLPEERAVLVVQIAKSQNELFGGTERYLVTREFAEISTPKQREHLMHCLFAVAAADQTISAEEEGSILQIAEELGFHRSDFIAMRSRYSEKRAVMQGLNRKKK